MAGRLSLPLSLHHDVRSPQVTRPDKTSLFIAWARSARHTISVDLPRIRRITPMRNEDHRPLPLSLLSDFVFADSIVNLRSWTGRIPTATVVDVLLPLFGATEPAPLLPQESAPREFHEPMEGLAMREMFETGVFPNLFGPLARPETLCFSRTRQGSAITLPAPSPITASARTGLPAGGTARPYDPSFWISSSS
jgi:hypothetical protein